MAVLGGRGKLTPGDAWSYQPVLDTTQALDPVSNQEALAPNNVRGLGTSGRLIIGMEGVMITMMQKRTFALPQHL